MDARVIPSWEAPHPTSSEFPDQVPGIDAMGLNPFRWNLGAGRIASPMMNEGPTGRKAHLPSFKWPAPRRFRGQPGKSTETVAVELPTTAYKLSGSAPVVGTSSGVLAAIGNPVEVVTPEPPR